MIMLQVYRNIELMFRYGTPQEFSVHVDMRRMPPAMSSLNGLYGVNTVARSGVRVVPDISMQRAPSSAQQLDRSFTFPWTASARTTRLAARQCWCRTGMLSTAAQQSASHPLPRTAHPLRELITDH